MSIAETPHLMREDRMGMRSVCAFSHLTSLPGVALYHVDTQKVRLDRYAAQLLGVSEEACTLSAHELLRYLGQDIAKLFVASMRLLHDGRPPLNTIVDGQSANSTNLRFTIPHGAYKGSVLYVRMSAFFDGPQQMAGVMFNLSRLLPNRLALIPEMLSLNSKFNWLIKDNILIMNSNYYQRLGYVRQVQNLVFDFDAWERYLVHPQDRRIRELLKPLLTSKQYGDKFDICFRTRKLEGNYIWTRSVGTVIARDAEGNALRVIGHNSYINEVTDNFERLRTRVYTDVLTGLKNRTYFSEHLSDFLSPQLQPLGIFFFDATALKLYNDYLGHVSGDKLLFSIASLLQDCFGPDKELIRISGDELIAIMPHCCQKKLQQMDQTIEQALAQRNSKAPLRMPVFFSHGSVCLDLNSTLYYEQFWQSLPPSVQQAFGHDGMSQCLELSRPVSLMSCVDERNDAPQGLEAASGAAASACTFPLRMQQQLQVRWAQWQPLQSQQEQAAELFSQAVHQADLLMQKAKKLNHDAHYGMIKLYLERVLKRSIDLTDKRLFGPSHRGPQILA